MAKTPKIKRVERGNKFKTIEKDAVDAPVKDIEWEGEQLAAESDIKLEDDLGTGHPVIIRFFDFGANPETFKKQKPTAQELFNSHRKGIESLLWRDELKPFDAVEPRLMFSKDKSTYRFIIACLPITTLLEKPKTLSELMKK